MVQINEQVAAQHWDGKWYLGRIASIEGATCTVRFGDGQPDPPTTGGYTEQAPGTPTPAPTPAPAAGPAPAPTPAPATAPDAGGAQ